MFVRDGLVINRPDIYSGIATHFCGCCTNEQKSQGWLSTLFSWGRRRQSREAEKLYAAAIEVARARVYWHSACKILLMVVLTSDFDSYINCGDYKLRDDGKEISQQLFDSMFADMDLSLREMGAGDIGVSKRVRVMAEAFLGRLDAYVTALDNNDRVELGAALRRNLFRDDTDADPLGNGAVDYVFALASEITNLDQYDLLLGNLNLS